MRYIDLRSDTVTQPTQAMRDAMAKAVVGDDVFEDDPTLHELETYAAERLGKEAAVFITSGMQGNACALMAHTRRGDCVIIDPHSHIADHEAGSYAQLSGVSMRYPQSVNGTMDPDSVRACLTDDSDVQVAPATLVVVENAHSSGAVVPLDNMRQIYEIAHEKGVSVHLDGARLFNAAAALGVSDVRELTQYCDTVMCCLSKGLCAPVGSMLVGSREYIERARRNRKMLGGGMRQCGFLAAAGLIALEVMTKRLQEDHDNAKYMAQRLQQMPGVSLDMSSVEINMVFFKLDAPQQVIDTLPEKMLEQGVKINGIEDGEFRFVTTNDTSREDIDRALDIFESIIRG